MQKKDKAIYRLDVIMTSFHQSKFSNQSQNPRPYTENILTILRISKFKLW